MSAEQATSPAATQEVLHCANHPDVETLLRCNRCGKPICLKCAVLTDVGYRCKECIRQVQDNYFTALTRDNWIALGVGFGVALIATPIVGLLFALLQSIPFGFWLGLMVALFIGSGAGVSLSQIIRRAVGRRRGRYLPYFAIGGIIFGVLVALVLFGGLFPLINLPTLVFGLLAITSAYPFLR